MPWTKTPPKKPARPKPSRATAAKPRSAAKARGKRKYLSAAMLETLIRESPTPALANEGPAKPPFDLQDD